jgi:capsular polysaccharide transport system permease protein
VDTFDPHLSKKIAEAVLVRTETFINDINHAVADQQLVFVKTEVERAESHVKEVTLEMLNLQNKYNIITPEAAISENLNRMQGLRLEQLELAKNVATLKRDSPDSPLIDKLQSELCSLEELIREEGTRISGPEQDRLNQILAEYKELDLKLEFAIRMRASAEALLEKHRIEAAARSRFISTIQKPYLPEDVGYPLRTYASISILICGCLLFTILRVIFQAISEKI